MHFKNISRLLQQNQNQGQGFESLGVGLILNITNLKEN